MNAQSNLTAVVELNFLFSHSIIVHAYTMKRTFTRYQFLFWGLKIESSAASMVPGAKKALEVQGGYPPSESINSGHNSQRNHTPKQFTPTASRWWSLGVNAGPLGSIWVGVGISWSNPVMGRGRCER